MVEYGACRINQRQNFDYEILMHPRHNKDIVKSFQFLEKLLGVRPDNNVVLSIIDYLLDVAVQYTF